ncbi:MAG TPA: UxaA family hydrolase [Bacillota bacterium]|nr:UxaA family hydrolase [Bacillota bacterium]
MPDTLVQRLVDNVATALRDLAAGEAVDAGGRQVAVRGVIPFGHKLAIAAIAKGERILKYGQPIGRATADIAPGEHVHVHNVESERGRGDQAGGDPVP